MDTKMSPELSESIQRFQQEMEHVDDVIHVLLKGHLLLEGALARIFEQHVFHSEHLSQIRLSFHQKMVLARTLCLRKDRLGEWDLLAAINTLRNELAHKLNSPERDRKLSRVRDLYFREAAGYEGIDEIKKQPDAVIVLYSCAHCAGFLSSFEADSKSFRKIIHTIDRDLNPELPEFEL